MRLLSFWARPGNQPEYATEPKTGSAGEGPFPSQFPRRRNPHGLSVHGAVHRTEQEKPGTLWAELQRLGTHLIFNLVPYRLFSYLPADHCMASAGLEPDLKLTTSFAGKAMAMQDWGMQPSRAGRPETANAPKPAKVILSPATTASVIARRVLFNTISAKALVSSRFWASFFYQIIFVHCSSCSGFALL